MMHPVAKALRDILISIAKQRGTICYSDLAPQVGMHHRSRRFHQLLGDISEAECAKGRPLLSAVVINKQLKRPGPGFLGLAQSQTCARCRGLDDKQCWRQEVARVYAYWS